MESSVLRLTNAFSPIFSLLFFSHPDIQSIPIEEFELLKTPSLGTTNIDFSAKLAKEIERFRTDTDVTLSVNPDGFTVDMGVMPEHIEKK